MYRCPNVLLLVSCRTQLVHLLLLLSQCIKVLCPVVPPI
nr:MAG TPA: hypothetical protein [Bacteriophage sp.]